MPYLEILLVNELHLEILLVNELYLEILLVIDDSLSCRRLHVLQFLERPPVCVHLGEHESRHKYAHAHVECACFIIEYAHAYDKYVALHVQFAQLDITCARPRVGKHRCTYQSTLLGRYTAQRTQHTAFSTQHTFLHFTVVLYLLLVLSRGATETS